MEDSDTGAPRKLSDWLALLFSGTPNAPARVRQGQQPLACDRFLAAFTDAKSPPLEARAGGVDLRQRLFLVVLNVEAGFVNEYALVDVSGFADLLLLRRPLHNPLPVSELRNH